MDRNEAEQEMENVVATGLRGWLQRARDAVMKPWRQFKQQPDPSAIKQLQGDWNNEVDTIITHLGRIGEAAWSEVTNAPSVSRHAFVMSQLAQTENLLVRIPDDIYNGVFAEIADAVNFGADNEEVARRVDGYLDWTGSENWPARAQTIARTEVTRAFGAGVQGAGAEMARVTGRVLRKRWVSHHDEKVRLGHVNANGQTQPFYQPFMVAGEPLMFPADPSGSPDNVINCRCHMVMTNEGMGNG